MSIINKFRANLPFEIRDTSTIFYRAEKALSYDIDFNIFLPTIGKNLQRDFVWTLQQKRELIYSIFKGIKLPAVLVILYADDSDRNNVKTTYKIIDGKQRLSTIFAFLKDEFTIEADGVEYLYPQLDKETQQAIAFLPIMGCLVNEYYDKPISDKDKIGWFNMINFAGTPQDKDHIKNLTA